MATQSLYRASAIRVELFLFSSWNALTVKHAANEPTGYIVLANFLSPIENENDSVHWLWRGSFFLTIP